ncbi:phosphoesterase [Pleurocapsa sp. CCALA 161]|uniref:CARDB domain-containing protein n=1 Tax=Pleurocapsa sp. CCALA 161 TaxID=2107688 RepID=UPI000D057482|nr:CARDB domain-containing protein [Pleurocapsa sp. CCALA 161]PSB10907.1 phosphoesterase [Pleurocapsa sp. CCALA 161]
MEQDLRVQFGEIEQAPTTYPDEQGRVQVTITNDGNESLTDGSLNLYASNDGELDLDNLNSNDDYIEGTEINSLKGTDELLGTLEGIDLAAGESRTVDIDFASEEFTNPSVVSPGVYNLGAVIDPNNAVAESDENNNQAIEPVSPDGTDAILDWNSVFLNASETQGKLDAANGVTLTEDTVPGEAPPIQAHDAAILSIAQYEAINAISAINGGESPYLDGSITPPEGASAEAAAVGAAYQVLTTLFPEQAATFELQRQESLAEINDSESAESSGFDFGVQVANNILEQRANDGVDQAQIPLDQTNYYENTEAGPPSAVLLAGFGDVDPFAISSAEDFRPDGPPEYGSEEFVQDTEEVRLLGGKSDTDVTQSLRTEEQTEIAQFWALDRNDSFRPPGQWIDIAQEVALDQGNSLEDNAKLFAQLNVALADAGIVIWDTKFEFNQQRPYNSIVEDDIAGVTNDPEFEPLLNTPPFPDYISGHSGFAGAAASVLESFFGEDVTFEVASQELPGVTRVFDGNGDQNSFQEAAEEDSVSRVYGGIHLRSSVEDSLATGQNVGQYVAENFLA